jgi:hypothetical protein
MLLKDLLPKDLSDSINLILNRYNKKKGFKE